MNKIIDITFDLETCDVTPSAAPMQLAAVAWDRTRIKADGDPFLRDEAPVSADSPAEALLLLFNRRADLTAAVMDGLSFSQDTIDFWSRQRIEAKREVMGTEPSQRLSPEELWRTFFAWCEAVKGRTGSDHICLWCQGQDFDIPMMKHCATKYGLQMPFNQYSFRDCRTLALEAALTARDRADEIFRHPKTEPYRLLPPMPDYLTGYSHDAAFDCIRSTWSTWHVLLQMKGLTTKE